jgi:hypothetical protein
VAGRGGGPPWRPAVGIMPKLSDAELVTLAVLQALLGFCSEAHWLRHARAHLGRLFPYLPKQPGYNKRLRAAAGLIGRVIRALATDTTWWTDDVWVADSTPWSVAAPGRPPSGPSWPAWGCGCCARPARASPTGPVRTCCGRCGQVIESINQTFKGQLDLERHGGRTPAGVIVRVRQRILAVTAAIWHNHHTGQPVARSLVAYDH